MNTLVHEFFGKLDLEKGLDDGLNANLSDDIIVLWEEATSGINTTLWYAKNTALAPQLLDTFAKFLKSLESYQKKAKLALVAYLKKDDTYLTFHAEEIALDVPREIEAFVQEMTLTNIGLWSDGENIIILDYMIDPEESDEILAVKLNSALEIVDIAWES